MWSPAWEATDNKRLAMNSGSLLKSIGRSVGFTFLNQCHVLQLCSTQSGQRFLKILPISLRSMTIIASALYCFAELAVTLLDANRAQRRQQQPRVCA